jgi:hypothetical protein
MFRAFAPIIRSTRPRLAAKGILSYLQMGGGGGVKSRRVGRVCGAVRTAHTHTAHSYRYPDLVAVHYLTPDLIFYCLSSNAVIAVKSGRFERTGHETLK